MNKNEGKAVLFQDVGLFTKYEENSQGNKAKYYTV